MKMEIETETHSTINDIRTIHNNIKNDIIREGYIHIPYKIPSENVVALDLACGRGGDMHKYYYNNYNKVICVDNHVTSLEIAQRRYINCYKNKPQNRGKPFVIEYLLHDLATSTLYIQDKVDIVVMNFAMNYFFESENVLSNVMRTVSCALKPGGLFIGIALNGKSVRENVENSVKSQWQIIPGNNFYNDECIYGKAYSFVTTSMNEEQQQQQLQDNNDDYFQFRNDSHTEYLLSIEELTRIALTMDMEHVYDSCLQNYSHVPIINLNIIFRYKKMRNNVLDNSVYFPYETNVNMNKLKMASITSSVCSREKAGRLLVSIIREHAPNARLIIDATAHVGCDTISIALGFKNVNGLKIYGIERDIEIVQMLRNNIQVYNLTNRVSVFHENSVSFLKKCQEYIDVLYIDTPWEHNYKHKQKVSLTFSDIDISEIVCTFNERVDTFIFKVPFNFDYDSFYNTVTTNFGDRKITFTNYCPYSNIIKFKFVTVSRF